MRNTIFTFLICLHNISYCQIHRQHEEKYVLIKLVKKKIMWSNKAVNVTIVNQRDVDQLNEPLRALAVYYSGCAQNNCINDDSGHVICELTTALGLGYQGSDKQIGIIEKWFPDDKTAETMIKQNCFVGMAGCSDFADYSYLNFTVKHDTVIVNCKIGYYDHGKTSSKKYQDIALIKKGKIVFINKSVP